MRSLKYEVQPVAEVDEASRDVMFALFERYYDAVDRSRFEADLDAKDHVILLRDNETHTIRGFSTLRRLTFEHEGVMHRGVYSGDTVIDKDYWGGSALGRAFLFYLLREWLRRPTKPLWWFLISKGYKTYLLMANNFEEHWPRFEASTPREAKSIMDGFAQQLFGDAYYPAPGLVRHANSLGHLREDIACIDEDLLAANPRVQFFQDSNPQWSDGDELVCVARMRWSMPFTYAWKKRRAFTLAITRPFHRLTST